MDSPTKENPKVFISYSWSSKPHCERIRGYADRLIADGVEVIIDQYDLAEGQDKYHFMETLIRDESVTHVLVFSDKTYTEKANTRAAGVGTESQIMSKTIYDQVQQTKFIPIVCEVAENGEFLLPNFLNSRIAIDFSTFEKEQSNWERLLRVLYGKPALIKPSLGKRPSYLDEEFSLPMSFSGKFSSFKDAAFNGKVTTDLLRGDFLDSALSFANSLRTRARPEENDFSETVLKTIHDLLPFRDHLIEWMIIETSISNDPEKLGDTFVNFLEKLFEFKFRPSELETYRDNWFDAHSFIVYEIFLYLIAILIEKEQFQVGNSIFIAQYLYPDTANKNTPTASFDGFYSHSSTLAARNQRLNNRRLSMEADLIRDRSSNALINFSKLMQADAVILLASFVFPNNRWFPRTLIYAQYGNRFPLFIRARQRRQFKKFARLYGGLSADELREKLSAGLSERNLNGNREFLFHDFGEIFWSHDWYTVE